MSEAMSVGEIEDVLASIRRLVSEDLRPVPRSAPAREAGDKLILTPALRVVEGDCLTERQPEVSGNGPGGAGAIPPPSSELQAVLDDITRPDGLFDAPFAVIFGEAQGAAPDPAAARPGPSIEAVVAAVGAAVTDQRALDPGDEPAEIEGDWVPDGWSDPVEAEGTGLADRDAIATVRAEAVVDPGPEPMPAGNAPWDGFVSTRDPVVAAAPDQPTPAADDAAARLRDDQAEAEAVAEITGRDFAKGEPAEAEVGAAAFAGAFDPEDAVLDEEILRDLVRDMIREELQGGLGERITRNVRKLVRAEINLALASRDFD